MSGAEGVHGRATSRTVASGSVYVGATVIVAAVAAWPVYAASSYLLAAAVAALAGAGVAVLATRRRWGGWLVAALLAGVFVVLSVPLAVPSRLGAPVEIVRGLGEAVAGLVFAWKDLVTVDLPVGSYRNLLVPALALFLVGTCVALLLSWRTDRWATAAVPVGLAMTSFGLFFGRTSTSSALELGPVTLHAPIETAVGVAGLTVALLWLAWRTHDERVRALHRAAGASGVRVSRRPSPTERRRTVLGTAMVVTALVGAIAVVPWAARGADRDVLRAAAGPERQIAEAVSPLSDFRAQFDGTPPDPRADQVLFRVSGDALPERVRLATLDTYDGEIFRPGGEADGSATPFVRVPAALDAGDGAAIDVTIEIDALSGIWMPTAGRLGSVWFEGDRSAALADGFYYSASTGAGVQTAGGGLRSGDAYRLRAVEPAAPALETLAAPGGDPGGVEAPENLRRWVEQHATGTDGAALAGLVTLLRERGFLSHALGEGEQTPSWIAELEGYSFQPSASGHSLARIDTLFARLLERESDPRAAASGNLVAAVGDEEQFAVATALMAGELGFEARVVVGVRLTADDPGLSRCDDDGTCLARDLTAWTEVRSADGQWVGVDVTPQWTRSPSLEVTEQRDPENVTEVRPDSVEDVEPPAPVQEDSARDDADDDPAGLDLSWLGPALRVTGIVLLVLAVVLGPFLAIVAAKAGRRRRRRGAPEPATRIAGGWEEYVDAGVDAGRDAPRRLTRRELAAAYGTTAGAHLADTADRAVFSRETATQRDADEFWRIVDAERRALQQQRGVWRRLRAAVSLRSFVRLLAPLPPARVPRIVERGRRRASRSGRTTS